MTDRTQQDRSDLTRRDFLRSATAAGAGVVVSQVAVGQDSAGPEDQINVALIGAGSQGRILLNNSLKIPGIRFKAVCDIWSYSQKYASNILKAYDQPVNVYEDYEEMLASENDLDAAFIATPDWQHAPITEACLDAGVHVYCEKEMAHNLEAAKRIVTAAQNSDQLVQIGHQRRSNPRFVHAKNMIEAGDVLGRLTHVRGQWNRATIINRSTPKKYEMDEAKLEKYGYGSMKRLRNWRWYKKYAGGPMCDLGSHHIDIFNWFLDSTPAAVQATGGLDFWGDKTEREWWDTVLATYDYKTDQGWVRGFYQVANTTSFRGFYTSYMGYQGSLLISEQSNKGYMVREQRAEKKDWEDLAEKTEEMGQEAIELEVGKTRRKTEQGQQDIKEQAKKPPHQPHQENFIGAIRGEQELTCPPEIGYETAVCVFKANEALRKGQKVKFKAADFEV